jgi:hypothetical protein
VTPCSTLTPNSFRFEVYPSSLTLIHEFLIIPLSPHNTLFVLIHTHTLAITLCLSKAGTFLLLLSVLLSIQVLLIFLSSSHYSLSSHNAQFHSSQFKTSSFTSESFTFTPTKYSYPTLHSCYLSKVIVQH